MKLKRATINRREIWRELCHCWGNDDHRYVHTHMMIVYKSYICAMQIVHSKSYGSCWIVIERSGTGSVIGCHGMSWSPRLMRWEETTIELTVTDRWGGCPVCVYVVPVEPTMAVVYYSLAELMSLGTLGSMYKTTRATVPFWVRSWIIYRAGLYVAAFFILRASMEVSAK